MKPRKLNPRVDADLDTICMKCLKREPTDRYASAAALADDLEHWLAGEAIQARPLSGREMLWRLCRRNPVPSSIALFVLLALTAATAVGLGLWARSEKRANVLMQEALELERETMSDLERSADLNFSLIDEQFGRFSIQLMNGIKTTDGGVENFEKAVRDLDPLYDRLEPLDPGNAQRAFRFGRLRIAMGDHLTLNRNKPQQALEWFERAVPLLESALQADPKNEEYRRYCWRAHSGWANALDKLGRDKECLPHRERAIELADGILQRRERLFRSARLARLGQHVRATREAEDLATGGPILSRPGTFYNLAITWAVAMAQVDRSDDVLKEQYARRAIEMLRKEDIAYFRDPRKWEEFRQEEDFAPLRGRPDFQAFCREIETEIKTHP